MHYGKRNSIIRMFKNNMSCFLIDFQPALGEKKHSAMF